LRNEPNWLKAEEIIAVCRDVVAQTDEPFILLRGDLLHSALDRPFNHWYYGEEDIVRLAGVLLLGIGQNHPFVQGNKRTAFLAAVIFLRLNGYRLDVDDSDFLGELIRDAIEGRTSAQDFVNIFRTFVIAA
jgi:death-on-curing protein